MWPYIALIVLPAVLSFMFISRDGDSFETATGWSIAIMVIQIISLAVGGLVGNSIAGLVFLFGLFLGYGRWYMKRLEELIPIPIGTYLLFDYRDWKFNFSKRRVKVTSFDNTYFTGFCDMRNAERTFRRDRVQNGLIVEETGEVIDPTAPANPNMHKK